jgi:spectrin beta
MTLEKPPKYKQKSMLDAHFYNINMKLTAQGHPKYAPPDGKTIHDLETAWSRLEKAEHARDLALKKELNRQEQLEQMYARFDKKAKLREDWLSEMTKILSNSASVSSISQIDATFRKQEAIGTDIHAREERFDRIDQLAKTLIAEDYFFKDTVNKRNQQIQQTYNSLIEQLEKRKATLATFQANISLR